MTRSEMLLTHLIEECDEVSQRATKALRFGLNEVQSGQLLTNAQRIVGELRDLVAVTDMLEEESIIPPITGPGFTKHLSEKRSKIVGWLKYSETQGTLDPCAS